MSLELYLAIPMVIAAVSFFSRDAVAKVVSALACLFQLGILAFIMGHGMGHEKLSSFAPWVPNLGLNWSLGIDGANFLLVILTPLMTFLAICVTSPKIPSKASFCACLLLLNGFLSGLFLAQNLGLFYIFFEAMLLPTLLIIAGWSRSKGRETALRFLMFTLVGSLPMMLGVLLLGFTNEANDLRSLEFIHLTGIPSGRQIYLVFPFLLAFIIKMPLVPFHGWLPPLYRNAPAAVVVVIAALMGKAGTYGLYKVGLTVFPYAMRTLMPYLMTLAVITILYGALAALGSNSLREVLAFASISHLAMIALGIFTVDIVGGAGANLQMAAHALATGGLFLAVAIFERRDLPDELRRFGGMGQHAPQMATMVLILSLASLGQPGLGSFPGELLILTGVYTLNPATAVIAALAIILAAAYMLRWYQGIFTGEMGTYRPPRDLSLGEFGILAAPILASLIVGLAPALFLNPVRSWLEGVIF